MVQKKFSRGEDVPCRKRETTLVLMPDGRRERLVNLVFGFESIGVTSLRTESRASVSFWRLSISASSCTLSILSSLKRLEERTRKRSSVAPNLGPVREDEDPAVEDPLRSCGFIERRDYDM